MSFISVLSAIGKGIGKAIGIIAPIVSVVSPFIPGGVLKSIAGFVAIVERAFEAAGVVKGGAQKLDAVLPLAAEAIRQSELMVGHEIADETLFVGGVKQVVNGVVDILKSLKSQ